MSTLDYDQFVKPSAPYGMQTPYFACMFGFVAAVARRVGEESTAHKVDFVFDEQNGVDQDLILLFHPAVSNLPKSAQKVVSAPPIFRSDRDYLPLQAADMLAWHVRREHEEGLQLCGHTFANRIRGKDHVVMSLDRDVILNSAKEMKKLPNVSVLQSKSQWRNVRKTMKSAFAAGFVPRPGGRWSYLFYRFKKRLAAFFRPN